MRGFISVIIAVMVLCGCIRDDEPSRRSLEPGDPLPSFSVGTLNGITVSNVDLKGSVSVICLFDVSCRDCRAEMPILQEVYEQYQNSDVKFICISRGGTEESVTEFWRELQLTMPVSAQPDASVFHLFADAYVPRIYISDRAGIIRQVFVEKATAEELTTAINHLQTI